MYAHRVSLLITVPVFGQHEYTHALGGDLERGVAKYLTVGSFFSNASSLMEKYSNSIPADTIWVYDCHSRR